MQCPKCKAEDTKVIDSRPTADGFGIRRRRKCELCEGRFTTYEQIEQSMPIIFKHDGRRETYDVRKIRTGLQKACHKRSVSTSQIDSMVDNVERNIKEKFEKEIAAQEIGELVMNELLIIDPVAYVRFASFYWKFEDVNEFIEGLKNKQRKK